jgi:acyl-CoA dehydrogenase
MPISDPAVPDRAALLELRREVREFIEAQQLAGQFAPRCDSWLTGWDPAFSRSLGERGWLGMTFPKSWGGGGRSPLERYVVTEELLAAGAPVAAHWFADRQIGPSLLRFGSDALRQSYLPGIIRGECYFAVGLSEAGAGSDLAAVRTRADKVPGGWRINGAKIWTSGAHRADAMFVLARTESSDTAGRHGGLSQFVVPLESPGLTVSPILLMSGEHHFNEVLLSDVFVPDESVLGEPGRGWEQVTAELAFERSGPERFLSTLPLLTVLIRELTSDDPLTLQTVGRLVAELWTLRQMSFSVAGLLAAGSGQDVPAAIVKDVGTRFESTIIDAARTLLDVEPDADSPDTLSRLLAEALVQSPGFTIRGGTNEILRGIIARSLTPRRTP